MSKVIPSSSDEASLHDDLAIIVSRILCHHLKFFGEKFSDVHWHIPHAYSAEMAKKSETVCVFLYTLSPAYAVTYRNMYTLASLNNEAILFFQVPLGVTLKSEMKYEEMIEIIEVLQKYVPIKEYKETYTVPNTGDEVQVKHQQMYQILFGGDQLTAARARGCQKYIHHVDYFN